MDYFEKIDIFIKTKILEEKEHYLIEENGLKIIDEDEMHIWVFNDGDMLFRNLFNLYGEPTAREYHLILQEIPEDYFSNYIFVEIIDFYISDRSRTLISEINDIYKKKDDAVLKIQRAFRKYRYDPKYKFCKLIQVRNLLENDIITRESFEEYLKKENIFPNHC